MPESVSPREERIIGCALGYGQARDRERILLAGIREQIEELGHCRRAEDELVPRVDDGFED